MNRKSGLVAGAMLAVLTSSSAVAAPSSTEMTQPALQYDTAGRLVIAPPSLLVPPTGGGDPPTNGQC